MVSPRIIGVVNDNMFLLAEVTPLSPSACLAGSFLGLCAIAASYYLLAAHLKAARRAAELHPPSGTSGASSSSPPANVVPETSAPEISLAIQRGGPWRVPAAVLLGICGVLVCLGVFINPAEHPRFFVYWWSAILLLVCLLLLVSGYDMLIVRYRALQQRRQLVESNRQAMIEELRDYHHKHKHGPQNGTSPKPKH